jgi:hypothetical protein
MLKKSSTLMLLPVVCIPLAVAAQSQKLELRSSSGVRVSPDPDDRNPALSILVPDPPDNIRSSKILFPEHVTVRAHGQTEQEHLYIFRPGLEAASPQWTKTDNALQYARDFGRIHFVARATLTGDGVVFRYDFTNHSAIDYDTVTAITDPRFHTVFYDPRLERTYVHHDDGFDLLASETPARLAMPLKAWFPVRYLASYTAPVPAERVQHRNDGITYYYKSRPVDVPMLATLSEDLTWVAASFARDPGNVWSNPELTCQHVDPEVPLPHGGHTSYEVKILILRGSLADALRKVLAQRKALE